MCDYWGIRCLKHAFYALYRWKGLPASLRPAVCFCTTHLLWASMLQTSMAPITVSSFSSTSSIFSRYLKLRCHFLLAAHHTIRRKTAVTISLPTDDANSFIKDVLVPRSMIVSLPRAVPTVSIKSSCHSRKYIWLVTCFFTIPSLLWASARLDRNSETSPVWPSVRGSKSALVARRVLTVSSSCLIVTWDCIRSTRETGMPGDVSQKGRWRTRGLTAS